MFLCAARHDTCDPIYPDVCLVLGYIPNCVEAVEAMLAAASIGAIWSSTSPDFGVVVSRYPTISCVAVHQCLDTGKKTPHYVIYNLHVH